MTNRKDIMAWLQAARGKPGPKFVTGLRGIGKRTFLEQLREQLLAEGVPADHLVFLDFEARDVRRCVTADQVLALALPRLPSEGRVYLFMTDAASLPDPEIVIGTISALKNVEIFATSSSRRLLDEGLANYFGHRVSHVEVLPDVDRAPYAPDAARRYLQEIFLYDVLSPNRIGEVAIAARSACYLSEALGDAVSLRTISAAISPTHRYLSPHTIEAYLKALCASHLVAKVLRWDLAEEAPQTTGYRYFFTDPELRLAYYGPAADGEPRRSDLNRAWLALRHRAREVYVASGAEGVDFVTRAAGVRTCWRVEAGGGVREVEPYVPRPEGEAK